MKNKENVQAKFLCKMNSKKKLKLQLEGGHLNNIAYHPCQHRQATTFVPSCPHWTKSRESTLESTIPKVNRKVALLLVTQGRSRQPSKGFIGIQILIWRLHTGSKALEPQKLVSVKQERTSSPFNNKPIRYRN